MPAPTPPDIDYPNWATADVDDPVTGLPNAQEPPDTKVLNGMDRLEYIPRQWFNWLFRSTGRWVQYLRELADFTTEALAQEVSDRGYAISSEASTRAAAVSSEASTRAAAISSEAGTRAAADTTLQNNINAIGGTWSRWTPSPLLAVSEGSGSISGLTGGYSYKIIGKTVFIHCEIAFSVTGAVTVLTAALPSAIGENLTGIFVGVGTFIQGGSRYNAVLSRAAPGNAFIYFGRAGGSDFPVDSLLLCCELVGEIA